MRSSSKGIEHGYVALESVSQQLYWIYYVKMRSSSKAIKHGYAALETRFQQ